MVGIIMEFNMWDLFHQWEIDLIDYGEIRLTVNDYIFFTSNSQLNYTVEKEEELYKIILID